MPNTRTLLTCIGAAALLLAGCGLGTARIPAAPASRDASASRAARPQPVPTRAPAVARQLAARWAAAKRRAPAPGSPVVFRVIDYAATVFSPGSPGGFTAFTIMRRTVEVSATSTAAITISNSTPPRFPTPADRVLWEQAGRPRLEAAPATSQEQAIPAGGFTFVPQGSPLTYQQAATLPGTPGGLAAVITAHVRAYAGPNPPASLLLKQVAFLIATAPLTRAARSAAWQVVGSLAGLRICPAGAWAQPPRPVQLCAASAGDETLVSIDVRTASILSISEILLRPSPLYPHVAAGKVVGSTSFPA
jgi:hypothetical protein